MEPKTLQNKENQIINIILNTQTVPKKSINKREKFGDLCFDIVKFLVTATIISTIFTQFTSPLFVFSAAVFGVISLIGFGMWLYGKEN